MPYASTNLIFGKILVLEIWPKILLANQDYRIIQSIAGLWCVRRTVFSGIVHQIVLIFGTMVDNSNIEKLTESFSPGKSSFGPSVGKKYPEWLQNKFFWFFEKFCHVSFSEK